MKPKYEKPEVMDLNVPRVWGQDIYPEGMCATGNRVGLPGTCRAGDYPRLPGLCFPGDGDDGGNACTSGLGVV